MGDNGSTFPEKEQQIALHEAGHVVAYHILRDELRFAQVKSVSMKEGKNHGGTTELELGPLPKTGTQEALIAKYAWATAKLAGSAAGQLFAGEQGVSKGDYDEARDAVTAFVEEEYGICAALMDATTRATGLVLAHYPAVKALADALLEQKELSGEKATEIIEANSRGQQ